MIHAGTKFQAVQDTSGRIPAAEPVFLVRGQDALAVEVLEHYIDMYQEQPGHDPRILAELDEHLDAIIDWQALNPDKVKVAD